MHFINTLRDSDKMLICDLIIGAFVVIKLNLKKKEEKDSSTYHRLVRCD